MPRAPLAALVIVLSALALAESARADPGFDPSFSVTLANPAPQAPSELTLSFRLESGYQLSTAVFYLPLDWGVARGDQIPIGAQVGAAASMETYGFINSACNITLPVTIQVFNANNDPSQTVSFSDTDASPSTNGIHSEPGAGGYVFSEESSGFGTQDIAEDKNGNGLLDAIDHYPDFLNTAFWGIRPITRLAGITAVAGVPILLQLLIFPPGSRLDLPERQLGQALADSPQSGYPILMVIQDFSSPDEARQPWPITDYCAPAEMLLKLAPIGDGPPLLVNPQAGAYGFTLVSFSKRDADVDGYQNSLDTCPFVSNVGNPTVLGSGDADQDGIDSACDPNDSLQEAGTNSDEDGDGYLNRQDNCPLVNNGIQGYGWTGYSDLSPEWTVQTSTQSDADHDDIGDACDPNPESPDSEALGSIKTAEVVVGDASGSGGPPQSAACPHCYRLGDTTAETDAEGEGGQLAVAIGLIGVGAGAAAVVIGSGTLYLLRRRRG